MHDRVRSLKASEKILFLQELHDQLLISTEEYRQLALYVLRQHARDRAHTQAAAEEIGETV